MDKKEEIARLEKKIKNVQFNINRIQQGKEAYNRNKIRRTRKHEPQQQVKKNKTPETIAIEEEIRKKFENLVDFITREQKNKKK